MTRKQALAHFLNWFGLSTGASEQRVPAVANRALVYPNPAQSCLYIKGPAVRSARVYDAAGRSVKTIKAPFFPERLQWDLTDDDGIRVSSGVYFILIENAFTNEVKKVVITR
jgi:hypothetical protein